MDPRASHSSRIDTPNSARVSAHEKASSGMAPKADSTEVKSHSSLKDPCLLKSGMYILSSPDILKAFADIENAACEDDMYPVFVNGLKLLIKEFPKAKQTHFRDTHNTHFQPLDDAHHTTRPDGADALRSESKTPKSWTWSVTALTFEFKFSATQDPTDASDKCKTPDVHADTRIQLYEVARNRLMAHLSCYVFVVGIYGETLRIFRFDHQSTVAS